jgi:hypothetical protein
MKNIFQLALLLTLMVGSASAKGPHLAGFWKGNAQVNHCGKDSGTAEVTLELKDPDSRNDRYSGPLTVKYSGEVLPTGVGILDLGFFKDSLNSALAPSCLDWTLRGDKCPYTDYYADLKVQDPYVWLGYYQTIKGTLSKGTFCAGQTGGREVLTVILKKQ